MLIVGLTGSIGMGKSAVAEHFRARGIGVFDADADVHQLYRGAAAPLIDAAFPGTVVDGVVDRGRLAVALGSDEVRFKALEAIVHPLVRADEQAFLQREAERVAKLAVLEIPLLFETGADRMVDVTMVVSATAAVQKARVMLRPGMTEERFHNLVSRQMPDAEKRRRADIVVDTSVSLAETLAAVDAEIERLATRQGRAFREFWS